MFVNKSLLSGSAKLDAPLFVTWYQCVVTVLACYVIRQLARYFPGKVGWALWGRFSFLILRSILLVTTNYSDVL